MKKIKLFLELVVFVILGTLLISSGENDTNYIPFTTPKITNSYSSYTSDYQNIVLAADVQNFLGNSIYETNHFYLEFNITNVNNQEFVIQAKANKGRIYFYGPILKEKVMEETILNEDYLLGSVIITPKDSEPLSYVSEEVSLFAGVKNRDTISFLDYLFFPNSNSIDKETEEVLSLVIEFPNELIANSHQLAIWTEIKKQ
ncbi:hypothetical protein GOQ30_09615 [Flavobacterium sp. TP390]|uniref:Uncharacterized protein n=1 Tax=Flavobacterium profundi TaxID=1774945 RepID=A0A6I4II95_9FLAO|nr:hypothetical protein [Flavobacterium profundi]MVO09415.1 hypothetical protein [Flavobacterium profundi]